MNDVNVNDKLILQWMTNSVSEVNVYLIGDAVKKLLSTEICRDGINKREYTITSEWFNTQYTPVKLRIEWVDNFNFIADTDQFVVNPFVSIDGVSPVAVPTNVMIANSYVSNTAFKYAKPNELKVKWTDNSTAETFFVVERKDSKTGWKVVKDDIVASPNTGTVNEYLDTTVEANTEYTYRIHSIQKDVIGDISAEAKGTTGATAPTNVGAAPLPTYDGVKVTWAYDGEVSGFVVDRYDSSNTLVSKSLQGMQYSYDDKTTAEHAVYKYIVSPYNNAGRGESSAEVSVASPYILIPIEIGAITETTLNLPTGTVSKVTIPVTNRNASPNVEMSLVISNKTGGKVKQIDNINGKSKEIIVTVPADMLYRNDYWYTVTAVDNERTSSGTIVSSAITPIYGSIVKLDSGDLNVKLISPEQDSVVRYEVMRVLTRNTDVMKWGWEQNAGAGLKPSVLETPDVYGAGNNLHIGGLNSVIEKYYSRFSVMDTITRTEAISIIVPADKIGKDPLTIGYRKGSGEPFIEARIYKYVTVRAMRDNGTEAYHLPIIEYD